VGLDERSRAADSLASVLAVYDGFCNLKQVRPSIPPKSYRFFFFDGGLTVSLQVPLCSFASRSPLGFVGCYWPFKALTFSPGFRFQRCSPCVKFFGPVQQPVKFLARSFRSLHFSAVSLELPPLYYLDGHVFLFSFFFLQRLQVSDTLIFFDNHRCIHLPTRTIELQIFFYLILVWQGKL